MMVRVLSVLCNSEAITFNWSAFDYFLFDWEGLDFNFF